jgi:hypothetical protein
MKAYLGLRDAGDPYRTGGSRLFGIDAREHNVTRIRAGAIRPGAPDRQKATH